MKKTQSVRKPETPGVLLSSHIQNYFNSDITFFTYLCVCRSLKGTLTPTVYVSPNPRRVSLHWESLPLRSN